MEPLFIPAFGVMVAVAAYLLLSRNLLRMLLGLLVLSNAANLSFFIAGRLRSNQPPLVPEGQLALAVSANPLPQALILTAIVISFALVVYAMVLFQNAHRALGTMDTDAMRAAEPVATATVERKAATAERKDR
jgi:multicomponent Na+:H+ antiporter subunit C